MRFLILAVWFWALPALGLYENILPMIQRALGDIRHASSFSFLESATPEDLEMLSSSAFRLKAPTWKEARQEPFGRIFFLESNLAGNLAEVYLNTRIRASLPENSGLEFIDSASYDANNVDGARPDGLLVRREAGNLDLETIYEVKLNAASYSPEQLRESVRVWQTIGITLPDKTSFDKKHIKIRLPDGTHPILSFDLENPETLARLEPAVKLFASFGKAPPSFGGTLVTMPLNVQDLHELASRALAYGWLGIDAKPEQVQRLLDRQPKYVRYFKIKDESSKPRAPVPKRVIDDHALYLYIEENLDFPTATQDKKLASYLTKTFRSRMGAFAGLLDDELRNKLVLKGRVPNQASMEDWFRKIDVAEDPELVDSIFRIYLNRYGKQPIGPSELLKTLRERKSSDWETILNRYSVGTQLKKGCGPSLETLVD